MKEAIVILLNQYFKDNDCPIIINEITDIQYHGPILICLSVNLKE